MTRVLPFLATLALLAGLAGCGSSHPATTASAPATSPATASGASAATSPTAPTQTSAGASAPPSGQPAGGPVPRGFDPVSFTAISAREYWLLGTAPCSNPVCTSIVRTTDGGAHFVGIPAPVAPLASAGTGAGITELRFANRLDGFAGGNGVVAGPLWETHDGGEHWHPGLAHVITFTVSSGRVYALTGTCAKGTCSHLALAISPARADDWTTTTLPVSSASGAVPLAAYGSSVWLSLTPAAAALQSQTLIYSSDGGRRLQTFSSPCTPGLGGDLEPSSAQVLWAVCPTGMLAQAWRSADAGAHWKSLPIGRSAHSLELSNGARIGPASDTTAVLTTGGVGPVLRTDDSGQAIATVAGSSPDWFWIGFTDPETGSALGSTGGSTNGLWRSYDGGARWAGPVRIG